MKKVMKLALGVFLAFCGAVGVQAQTLRGTVNDTLTGKPIWGAMVLIEELPGAKAVTDKDGNYEIKVEQPGNYTLRVTYLGYTPCLKKKVQIRDKEETRINITLREIHDPQYDKVIVIG